MARKMKDSGIEWIGAIPNHWSRCEIKYYCTTVFPGATPSTSNPEYWDGTIPWIPSGSCHDKKITEAPRTITEAGLNNSSTKLIPANTALVAMTGATCGNTGYLTFESCANQSVTAFIEDKSRCNSVYLWYLLRAAKEYLLTFQTGGAQAGVNVENCKNLWVPYAPLEEQARIADYLDRRCAEIDRVIADTQKTIEEYKALKQSIITEAVTHGVRGERPMKDSGVEWIGGIPAEWNVLSFTKSISSIVDYRGKTPEKQDDGTLLVTARNIKEGKIDYECSREYVRTEDYDEIMHRGKVEIGDVIFTTEAPLGAVANADRTDFALAQRIVKFQGVPSVLSNYYLKFWIMSAGFQQNLASFSTGSTAKGIKASKFGMLKQILPPIDEQQEIVGYLNEITVQLDAIIERKTTLASELEAYKRSVIYEYVTGKKEVPVCP